MNDSPGGTMAATHQDLVRALAHDKGNLSHTLRTLEARGLIRVHRTPGGKAESEELISIRQRMSKL